MPYFKGTRRAFTSPLGIALLYVVVSGLWIVMTDIWMFGDLHASVEALWLHSLKEFAFLGLTAFGLFFLVRWGADQLRASRDKLKERNAELSTLIKASPVAVIVVELNREITLWNRAATQMLGWSEEEVVGKRLESVLNVERLRQNASIDQFATFSVWNELDEFETRNGEKILGRWTAVGLENDNGVTFGVKILIEDVSQQEEDKERLRLLETAVEHANEMVLVTEAHHLDEPGPKIVYVNRAFEKITGYHSSHAIGRNPRFLQGPETDPAAVRRIREALEQEVPVHEEVVNYRKDGTPYWIQINIAPVFGEDGSCTHFVAIERDVTERKKHEQELIKARDKAREMHRAKTTFLKNISHEIRTPLSAILGFAELLLEDSDGHKKEFAELVYVSGQRLHRTLNDILVLSRVESNSLEVDCTALPLAETISEFLQSTEGQPNELDVELFYHGSDTGAHVLASKPHLFHILGNLLNNAFKFTSEGHVTVRVDTSEQYGLIQVIDTGIGIGQDFLPQVFEEFAQESSGLSREYEGSGLGLAVVKSLAEKMGGSIDAESKKGQGSTFTLRLPLAFV